MAQKLNFHQKHDNIKSEVFRFVHVRKAGKSNKKEDNLSIIYNEKVLGDVRSNLFSKLCKLKDLTPEEAKKGLANLLKNYDSSPSLLDSETTLNTVYPGFAEFYDWTVGVKTEKVATVTSKLESLTGQVVNDIVANTNLQSRVWDNYFYYVLKGINAPMIQRLTEIIRVYEIAQELPKTKRKSINSLERANIVIPKCVMILVSIDNWSYDGMDTASENQTSSQSRKVPEAPVFTLKQLKQAKKDLYDKSQVEAKGAKSDEDLDAIASGATNISKKAWTKLDKNTQSVLNEGGYAAEKVTTTIAIDHIDGQIRKTYEQAFSMVSTSKRIALIGSSLVEIKNNPEQRTTQVESTSKNVQNRMGAPTAEESILSI